ncbi:hypothetical protein [Paralysiella testudinis]|uniref:Uncharacterized protein n=1 Tax=Paralysiella testudinis TaxID=2809020 RepID=A0A892ZJE7_9NEIS|nr:hypothetical protein [Paralysiella testudinis]QRQ81836.1 hypothetical protein JQU52_14445 [Paralysiella testudinis]
MSPDGTDCLLLRFGQHAGAGFGAGLFIFDRICVFPVENGFEINIVFLANAAMLSSDSCISFLILGVVLALPCNMLAISRSLLIGVMILHKIQGLNSLFALYSYFFTMFKTGK